MPMSAMPALSRRWETSASCSPSGDSTTTKVSAVIQVAVGSSCCVSPTCARKADGHTPLSVRLRTPKPACLHSCPKHVIHPQRIGEIEISRLPRQSEGAFRAVRRPLDIAPQALVVRREKHSPGLVQAGNELAKRQAEIVDPRLYQHWLVAMLTYTRRRHIASIRWLHGKRGKTEDRERDARDVCADCMSYEHIRFLLLRRQVGRGRCGCNIHPSPNERLEGTRAPVENGRDQLIPVEDNPQPGAPTFRPHQAPKRRNSAMRTAAVTFRTPNLQCTGEQLQIRSRSSILHPCLS